MFTRTLLPILSKTSRELGSDVRIITVSSLLRLQASWIIYISPFLFFCFSWHLPPITWVEPLIPKSNFSRSRTSTMNLWRILLQSGRVMVRHKKKSHPHITCETYLHWLSRYKTVVRPFCPWAAKKVRRLEHRHTFYSYTPRHCQHVRRSFALAHSRRYSDGALLHASRARIVLVLLCCCIAIGESFTTI